jgi:hypothetical protein
MKNRPRAVLSIVFLTVGFALMACVTTGSDNAGTAPVLTDFITVTEKDSIERHWISAAAFTVRDGINVGIKGSDPDMDVIKFILTLKKDNAEVKRFEQNIAENVTEFTQFMGSFPVHTTGSYTVEVYCVDKKSNRSNVLIAAFEVQ